MTSEFDKDANRNATNGGRALNAIWASNLSSSAKIFLLYLGSQADFRGDFTEFQFHSVDKLIEATGLSKRTLLRIAKGLETAGYIIREKRYFKHKIGQAPTNYRITDKIFDEHIIYLTKQKKDKQAKETAIIVTSAIVPPKECHGGTLTSAMVALDLPQVYFPQLNINTPNNSSNCYDLPLLEVTKDWGKLFLELYPKKTVDEDKWYKEMIRIKTYLDCDNDYLRKLFIFVKTGWWRTRASSIFGLRKTSAENGVWKLDNLKTAYEESLKRKVSFAHQPSITVMPRQEAFVVPERLTEEEHEEMKRFLATQKKLHMLRHMQSKSHLLQKDKVNVTTQ